MVGRLNNLYLDQKERRKENRKGKEMENKEKTQRIEKRSRVLNAAVINGIMLILENVGGSFRSAGITPLVKYFK